MLRALPIVLTLLVASVAAQKPESRKDQLIRKGSHLEALARIRERRAAKDVSVISDIYSRIVSISKEKRTTESRILLSEAVDALVSLDANGDGAALRSIASDPCWRGCELQELRDAREREAPRW